jgi:hypothetical protein
LAARETERSERRRARRKSMVMAVVASAAAISTTCRRHCRARGSKATRRDSVLPDAFAFAIRASDRPSSQCRKSRDDGALFAPDTPATHPPSLTAEHGRWCVAAVIDKAVVMINHHHHHHRPVSAQVGASAPILI